MFESLSLNMPMVQLVFSSLLGGFLGIRREIDTKTFFVKNEFMGFRSLSLISFFGTLSTFFPELPYLPVLFFSALILLMSIAYYHGRFKLGIQGMTTEVSSFCVFWIGVLVGSGNQGIFLAIVVTILLAIMNAYKYSLHDFIRTLTKQEWSGALQLGMISIFVLPLLPKVAIDPWGIFVPFNIWFLVVLISGIGFIGYFLMKYLGLKGGIPLLGFLGSMTSSLIVTLSLSGLSKKFKFPNIFAGGILIAIGTMQLRVLGEIFFLGPVELRSFLFIPLAMSAMSFLFGFYYCFFLSRGSHRENLDQKDLMKVQSPFELKPALKFGFIFLMVLFALALGKQYLGASGVYAAAVLSGFLDIDAIVLSSLEALSHGELSVSVTRVALLVALFVNTLTKSILVFFSADIKVFFRVTIGVLLSFIAGLVVFFLV